MPVASIVSKRTYLARESVQGTRQPPNKFLEGLNIRIVQASTVGDVRPSGSTMRTARPLVQNWSTFTVADGSYLDFNSALYLFSALFGVPTTTTPGGGTLSREHAFLYSSDGLNTRPSFTFAAGYRGGSAEESIRNVFQSIGFTFTRTAAPSVSGQGFGRDLNMAGTLGVNESQTIATSSGTITAGTFTIVAGGGTASIVYNATSGSVQTALQALTGLGTLVTTSGGPLPGTGVVVNFGLGTLANYDVPLLTLSNSGLTGGSLAVTETQKGGITTVPVKAVQAPQWSVYIDLLGGSVGTTKYRPYSCEFTFGGLVNPDWVIDAATTSYDDEVLEVPDLGLNIMLRNDTAARDLYTSLLAGNTYLVRFEAVGPVIEGALTYLMRVDCAVQMAENVGQFGDQGGAESMVFPLSIISDSTVFAGGFSALLRNILTSM